MTVVSPLASVICRTVAFVGADATGGVVVDPRDRAETLGEQVTEERPRWAKRFSAGP